MVKRRAPGISITNGNSKIVLEELIKTCVFTFLKASSQKKSVNFFEDNVKCLILEVNLKWFCSRKVYFREKKKNSLSFFIWKF